jgi:HSP20 family molecular chaperone IbpA
MSSLIRRFDPFAEMSRLQDEMGNLFGGDARRAGFTPAVDIYEDKEGFHVKAELPGLKPEEVHVNVENNMLTLRGERKLEKGTSARATTASSVPTGRSSAPSCCPTAPTPRRCKPR